MLADLAESGLPLSPDHRRLVPLRDLHKGRKGFLIGNGPSVRPEDLNRLAGEITFCCNRFHLGYGLTQLRPTYTLSADRQMIEDFGAEMTANAGGTVFLANPTRPTCPGDFIWLRFREVPSPFTANVLEYVFPHGGTLIVALQLGYYMGIREFYLYGVDHNFKFQVQQGKDEFRTAHGDNNHFIPNYRAGKAWCPPASELIERGFRLWHEKLAAERGGLFNATRGGHLEAVPRTTLEHALA